MFHLCSMVLVDTLSVHPKYRVIKLNKIFDTMKEIYQYKQELDNQYNPLHWNEQDYRIYCEMTKKLMHTVETSLRD